MILFADNINVIVIKYGIIQGSALAPHFIYDLCYGIPKHVINGMMVLFGVDINITYLL